MKANAVVITAEEFSRFVNRMEKLEEKIDKLLSNRPLEEEWLTVEDACRILRVSRRTLQTYRDNGIISFSQFGSKIYFRRRDLEKFLQSHYRPANDFSSYVK